MATDLTITTTATADELLAAFRTAFFTPGTFADRFKVKKSAAFRNMFTWAPTTVQDATAGAVITQARGFRDALSRKNGASEVGVTIGRAVDSAPAGTLAQIWLARDRTFFGMSKQGDLLKAYTKEICDHLRVAGHRADWAKTR